VQLQGFFGAAAGVAGTLIGLVFVALSVSRERTAEHEETQVHRVRGAAAFIAFLNALTVSLAALVSVSEEGWWSISISAIGFVFVAASGLALVLDRGVNWRDLPHLLFLGVLAGVFVVQFVAALGLVSGRAVGSGTQSTFAVLVMVSFIVGISRAWELVGGPSISPYRNLAEMLRPLTKLSRPRQ
jgi:predicted small integral membrane protein